MANLFQETLIALRPKVKLYSTLEEAEEAAEKVEKEAAKILRDKAPDLATLLERSDKLQQQQQQQQSHTGLGAIVEEDEDEDEEEDDFEEELELVEDGGTGAGGASASQQSRSRSMSQREQHGDDDHSPGELSQRDEFSQDTNEGEHSYNLTDVR